jgi:hypothetical protein
MNIGSSQTVFLSAAYAQVLSAYAPFELTIDPGSISVPNKVYKVSYDFGDGFTSERLLNLKTGSPLGFTETHQYFLTGSFVKNIEVNVNIYTFNTDAAINYKVYLTLVSDKLEKTSLDTDLCAYYNFNGSKKDATNNGRDLLGTYHIGSPKVGSSSAIFTTYGTCYSGPGLYYLTNLWDAYSGESGSYSFWLYYSTEITWPGGCSYGIFGQEFGNMGLFASFNSGQTGILLCGIDNSAETTIQDTTPLEIGKWYHISLVHDAANKTFKMYKNGILVESKTYTTLNRPYQNFQGFGINGTTWGSSVQYGVPCSIDAVGLWKRALSEDEVVSLYNEGNGLEYPFGGKAKEVHLVGSRMFGPDDDILYLFESIEPNYILPVLVNWNNKPAPAPKITIPPEYRPFKLLSPFENEAVTSIDYGSHVYSIPDGEGKYLPDPGNVDQVKVYDGNSVASQFFATIDNNWSNIANWKTDGGNASLYFPTTSVNVTVFEPVVSVSDGLAYARNAKFKQDTYLKNSTLVVEESAVFTSNSYNLGDIIGDAYFVGNSYNQGFQPTLLNLQTQGSDGSTTILDSSNYGRILTSTGNPYITSYPTTPNNLVYDGLVFQLDAEGYTGDGSTWVDNINGVVGTAQNSPAYVADSPSYFYLNGNSQAFNFTRWNSAVNLNNNFSIEAWVNVVGNNEWGGIVSLATGGYENFGNGQGEQYSLNTTNGQYFRFDVNTGSYLNGVGYGLNDWMHVVVTYASGVSKTYLNGLLADTQTIASYVNTIQDAYLSIGCNQYGGFEYFNGKVGLVNIYNKVLSPLEILQNFGAKKSRFSKNAPFGSFLYFDGSSKIQPLSGGTDFSFGIEDFTIEGWICPTRNNGTSQVFYDTRPQGGYSPLLYLRSGLYLTFHDGYGDVIQGGYIPLNTWNHIAVSRSANKTKLFLNGVQTGGVVVDNRNYISSYDHPLIGSSFDNYNFKGFMEYFKVTKGIGKYTTNFTPPTSLPLNDPYTTGTVSNTAFFNDNSFNLGTLTNAVFSGNSQNFGTVENAAVWYPQNYPLSGNYTTVNYYGYHSLSADLVGYWEFEEAGGNRYDATGNGNTIVEAESQVSTISDLTINGYTLDANNGATNDTGILGEAILFTATDGQYLKNTSLIMDGSQSDYTLSVWISANPNQNSYDYQRLLSNADYTGFCLYYQDGYIYFSYVGQYGHGIAPFEANNTWQHIVINITNGGTRYDLYVNGDYVDGTDDFNSYAFNTPNGITIGGDVFNQNGTIRGSLDEVGIWSRALSPTEITALYNSGAAIAYPFVSEPSLLTDITAYWDMNPTPIGSTTGIIADCAYITDGNATWFKLPAGICDPADQPKSYSLWFKLDQTSVGYQWLLCQGDQSDQRNINPFYLENNSTLTTFFTTNGYYWTNSIGTSVVPTANEWHHVVLTLNGSVAKLYYDGNLVGSTNYSGTIQSTNSQFTLGHYNAYPNGVYGTEKFAGKFDEFGIWDRELSKSEVNFIYNNRIARGLPYPYPYN